jgi:hypothetical protein
MQVIRAQGYSVMFPESAKHHGLSLIADKLLVDDITDLCRRPSCRKLEAVPNFKVYVIVISDLDIVDDVWFRAIVALKVIV